MKHQPGGEDLNEQFLGDTMSLTIPGTLEAVPKARHQLSRWLRKHGAVQRALAELELVLTEICNNSIEHGSATATLPLALSAVVNGNEVQIEVKETKSLEDSDVLAGELGRAIKTATFPPDAADERGRGLFLIQAYVDHVTVESTSDGCLRIQIRKQVSK